MTTLITIYELEKLSDQHLQVLHETLSRLLMATDLGSPDRRNILATLENIETVQHARLPSARRALQP